MAGTPFEDTLTSFKLRLTKDELTDFEGTTFNELRLTIAGIQKGHLNSRTNRNVTRLRTFLEAIQSYATVLDLFVNVSEFVAFIWGPIKYLLLMANVYTGAFTTILEIYESIGQEMPLLEQYQDLFHKNDKMRQALEHMFESIFEFHLRALRFFKGNKCKQIFNAHAFRSKFDDVLKGLRQHKMLVERHADLIEFQEAKQARLDAVRHYQAMDDDERLRRAITLRGWLNAPNMPKQQETGALIREYRPDSGRWLLSRDKYKTWATPSGNASACLWIHGKPGAGKTVLASLLVEECKKIALKSTAYFYFRHSDSSRDNFISMSRSLLDQFSVMHDSVADILYEAANGDEAFQTKKATRALLRIALDAAGPAFIIIDGLDECAESEQKDIAVWLRKYADDSSQTRDPTRCVFLSQHDDKIQTLFAAVPSIQIKSADTQADIKAYCLVFAKQIQSKFGETDERTKYIVEAVSSKADGMFLYAKLVLDNLWRQTSLSGVRSELDPRVFPDGLNQAYGRVLKRVLSDSPEAASEGARRILAWLVCAMRPIKWREIQCAVSVDPEAGEHNSEKLFVEGPKELCGSLVELQPDGGLLLVHTTARIYLLSSGTVFERPEHLRFSRLCLDQFCFSEFDESLSDDDLVAHVSAGDFALLEYATVYWTTHLVATFKDHTFEHEHAALEEDVGDFVEVLEIFLGIHWMEPAKKLRVPSRVKRTLTSLPQIQPVNRVQLLLTLASIHGLASSELTNPSSYETLKIYKLLRKVRQIWERLIVDPKTRSTVEQYHGASVFKCPRMYCERFFDGFDTADDRDDHVAKHERAHYCPYLDCTHAKLGCTTADELEAHLKKYHESFITKEDLSRSDALIKSASQSVSQRASQTNSPRAASPSIVQLAGSAANSPQQTSSQIINPPKAKRIRKPGPFPCQHCANVFKLASRLRSHMRTHTDEKPWVCNVCQKAFSRQPDLNRHGKVHLGHRKFVCHGNLENGGHWGCGKKFTRADGLARHYKGDKGKLCMKPLADEQEAQRQQNAAASVNGFTAVPNAAGTAFASNLPFTSQQQLGNPMVFSTSNSINWGVSQPVTAMHYSHGNPQPLWSSGDVPPLPDALYEQYPQFTELNWDSLPPELP